MAAPSGCLPWLNSCSPLPARSELYTKPGVDSPSSSRIPAGPLLSPPGPWGLSPGRFLGLARSSSFPGLPEVAAIPSSPAEAPLSAPSPVCALWGDCLESILLGAGPRGEAGRVMRFLAALSASCKRLLERLARQIHKCNLPLPLYNERGLCGATTTKSLLWEGRQQQAARRQSHRCHLLQRGWGQAAHTGGWT